MLDKVPIFLSSFQPDHLTKYLLIKNVESRLIKWHDRCRGRPVGSCKSLV